MQRSVEISRALFPSEWGKSRSPFAAEPSRQGRQPAYPIREDRYCDSSSRMPNFFNR